MLSRASALTPGRSCSTRPAPRPSRKACRGVSKRNVQPPWLTSLRINMRTAREPSVLCRLNLLRSRVVVRVQHAPNDGLPYFEAASQLRLAHAKLPNGPVESEFGHDPQWHGHRLLPAFETGRLGYGRLVSHRERDTAAQTVNC